VVVFAEQRTMDENKMIYLSKYNKMIYLSKYNVGFIIIINCNNLSFLYHNNSLKIKTSDFAKNMVAPLELI
jgi:hypothetical protein